MFCEVLLAPWRDPTDFPSEPYLQNKYFYVVNICFFLSYPSLQQSYLNLKSLAAGCSSIWMYTWLDWVGKKVIKQEFSFVYGKNIFTFNAVDWDISVFKSDTRYSSSSSRLTTLCAMVWLSNFWTNVNLNQRYEIKTYAIVFETGWREYIIDNTDVTNTTEISCLETTRNSTEFPNTTD